MSGEIQFHLDEHIPRALASGLKRRGIDVTTSQDSSLPGTSDLEQLSFAVNESRVLVTRDDDFLKRHARGIEHSGIVFVARPIEIGRFVRELFLIYQVLEPADMKNHVEFL